MAATVAGAQAFAELLDALGFRPVAEVHKTRRPVTVAWQDHQVTGALDNVDGLGQFVELELCVNASQIDSARTAITSLAEQLGLSQTERRSYLELLLERAH